jgi:hypothetical protein
VRSNKGFIILPIILAVVFVILATFVVFESNSRRLNTNSNLAIPTKTTNLQPNQINLIGMIWTSGLVDSELEVLDLNSEYQLTKSLVLDGWLEKITGMFLVVNNNLDLQSYLGKCVMVNGKIKNGWEDIISKNYKINGKWTYNRSALIVDSIKVKDLDLCIGNYDRTIKDKNVQEGLEYKTAKGTLGFTKRTAPDISYDLEIILDEPFIDELNASGNPVLTKRLDISSGSDEIYKQIISNIGKNAEASGYMEWGYAESRFLSVDKLKIL